MLEKKEISAKFMMKARYVNMFEGEEGYITSFSSSTLAKIFKTADYLAIRNKQRKLEILSDKNISFFTNPISELTRKGNFVGYEMKYEKNYTQISKSRLKKNDLLVYLKKLKKILKELEQENIVYTDLRGDNILVDEATKDIKLCDVDNIEIEGLKTDTYLRTVALLKSTTSLKRLKEFDFHCYMHNLLLINEYLELYRNNLIPSENVDSITQEIILRYFTKEVIEIIEEMGQIDFNPKGFSKRYIIDYLK